VGENVRADLGYPKRKRIKEESPTTGFNPEDQLRLIVLVQNLKKPEKISTHKEKPGRLLQIINGNGVVVTNHV
jgi:hypothetical protein